ncbi:MAG: Ig-like domain-containing protein [Bacteroidales bacterium]
MKIKIKLLSAILATMLLAVFITSCKEDVSLTSIDLNQANATVMVGATLNLSVIYSPVDATNKAVTWSSDNEAVATVSNGAVTGVSLGTAIIKAKSSENDLLEASCTITVTPSNGQQITVSGDITQNTTWYSNARYFLSGFVFVKNNATLTIQPGTIIKSVSGTKGALIIERGSKIMAQGTLAQPIVFTSDKPAGQRAAGDWGGVVICGKATTNKHDEGTGVGIAEGGIGSRYGGTDDADNSGILQYVRIEFPGIALTSTSNSEINGLTLYSVGSGTVIDHIQVSYSGDDSFEWFGGTVNAKYLVAHRGLDDDFDTDNGFRGKVQFILGLRDPQVADQSGSNGFESDNDADGSTLTPVTSPVFSNVTLLGPLAFGATPNTLFKRAMHLRRSTQLSVYNSIFVGWPKGLLLDGTTGNTPTMAGNNTLQIEKSILAGMTVNFEAASGTPATPYSVAEIQTYFEDASRGNSDSQTVADIIGASLLTLMNPNIVPAGGSAFLTGASFTNTKLTDSFFTVVAYKGAFGATNWTSGWCNFDPQNTAY